MLFHIIVISAGLFCSLILFYRFPLLKNSIHTEAIHKVSVIIPARNEEDNLSELLQDLKQQNYPIYEIICIDDGSTDETAKIAASFGVKVITITDKPKDWTGKSWACQKGSEIASGDILLFLDADVRLSSNGISSLMQAYEDHQCVISVQPYHHMEESYEEFSMFFNMIQIGANGTSTIFNNKNVGLYGPVILIHHETYKAIEGHRSVKNSIVDDLAMGEKLKQIGFSFKLLLGRPHISFRMYRGGFVELLRGWTKNYATGALKTPLLLFVMVFLWITSCISVFICFIQSLIALNLFYLIIFTSLLILWILELFRIAGYIGNFKKVTIIGYPIYMAFFLWVIILSFIKKIFRLNVVWKDRKIKLEK